MHPICTAIHGTHLYTVTTFHLFEFPRSEWTNPLATGQIEAPCYFSWLFRRTGLAQWYQTPNSLPATWFQPGVMNGRFLEVFLIPLIIPLAKLISRLTPGTNLVCERSARARDGTGLEVLVPTFVVRIKHASTYQAQVACQWPHQYSSSHTTGRRGWQRAWRSRGQSGAGEGEV